MNPFERASRAGFRPIDRTPPSVWCGENVHVDPSSPFPGKWRLDHSPWVGPVMDTFPDNRVTDISVMCSAQSSKTQTFLCLSCWIASEDPGPTMWVMANGDDAKQFVRDRLTPTILGCKKTSDLIPGDRHAITNEEISFPAMPYYITGAGSKAKLQSKPIRWLLLDEVRNYAKGAVETVLKRTRAYWNARRCMVSTPGNSGDAVHRAYLAGNQQVFHIKCPSCGHFQPLEMKQLKWETSEKTRPGGVWEIEKVAPTIRYECAACEKQFKDVPKVRKGFARDGKFIALNPKAPKHRRSFHWNALLPPWVSWASIVEEFVQARAAIRLGEVDPMFTFITETLGQPWEERLGIIEDFGFLEARKRPYGMGDTWSDEEVRFLGADRQAKGGEHYWYIVRAFNKEGQSRLISCGKVLSKSELEATRMKWNVKPQNAVLDTGYNAGECYRFCAAHKWKALKGSDRDYFTFRNRKTKKTYRRMWQKTEAHPGIGTKERWRPIPLFLWSNSMAKDHLAELMLGQLGDWTIPEDTPSDYFKQVTAERRAEKMDSQGRTVHYWHQTRPDNHLLDCELQILVAAIASKTLLNVGDSD